MINRKYWHNCLVVTEGCDRVVGALVRGHGVLQGLVQQMGSGRVLVMSPDDLLAQILQLPPDQRLQLVEQIWESLATSAAGVPVPGWHREELDRRLADASEQATLSWDEVQQQLKPGR